MFALSVRDRVVRYAHLPVARRKVAVRDCREIVLFFQGNQEGCLLLLFELACERGVEKSCYGNRSASYLRTCAAIGPEVDRAELLPGLRDVAVCVGLDCVPGAMYQ